MKNDIMKKFDNEKFLSCGLTEISLLGGKILRIEHAGNMGNSLVDVSKNIEMKLGISLRTLKDHFVFKQNGSPDYYYICEIFLNKGK